MAAPAGLGQEAAVKQSDAASVRTLAGPGYCPGTAVREKASSLVGALAADANGDLFYDVGPPRAGLVAKVTASGRPSLLVSGVPRGEDDDPDAPAARRLAPDGAGGVLIAAGHKIVRVAADNALTTIAGDAAHGSAEQRTSGDGGPAVDARFRSAMSLAADPAGGLYIAEVDAGESVRVRFINRGPAPVTFFAGTPQQVVVAPGEIDSIVGPRSENGPTGTATRTPTIRGRRPVLAVEGPRLYIATAVTSAPEHRVQLVNLGDEAISAHGAVFGAGEIATVVGPASVRPEAGGRVPDISFLPGVAADTGGNLYLVDEQRHRILKVGADGSVSTLAGGSAPAGEGGFNGNRRLAHEAWLNHPYDVGASPTGAIYIADRGNGQVRVVTPDGLIRAVPGSGLVPSTRCATTTKEQTKASPPRPQPGAPTSVAVDNEGVIYFVAADMRQVKRIRRSGQIDNVVGSEEGVRSCSWGLRCGSSIGDGGIAAAAVLQRPTALTLSPQGGLYVLDAGDARVRFVNLGARTIAVHGVTVKPGTIQTVAGRGVAGFGGDGGRAVDAELGGAEVKVERSGLASQLKLTGGGLALGSLAVDESGNLLIADVANRRVRQVDASGRITTIIGDVDSSNAQRCCRQPVALALDRSGNLFVSDSPLDERFAPRPQVWFVNRGALTATALGRTADPGQAVVVAGTGEVGFEGDGGPAIEAHLLGPSALAVDGGGNLYFTEVGGDTIDENSQYVGTVGYVRKVDAMGTISGVAGDGTGGFDGDRLPPQLTSLNFPLGLAIGACGNLVVADTGNDRVRRVNLEPDCHITPGAATGAGRTRPASGLPWLPLGLTVIGVIGVVGFVVWRLARRSAPQHL